MCTRLSVNLNKIALLRNSRHTGVPDLLKFASMVREAGADGITVHPRPDERHIRRDDALRLGEWMKPWRPDFELNVEGYPDARFLGIMEAVRPEQVTFVPDSPTAFTSDKGWLLDKEDCALLMPAIQFAHRLDARVILFSDPDPAVVPRMKQLGVDGIEIYTGSYAAEYRRREGNRFLRATSAAPSKLMPWGCG